MSRPDPIVNQRRAGHPSLVEGAAIADEGEWNDDEIRSICGGGPVDGVHEFDAPAKECSRRFDVFDARIDDPDLRLREQSLKNERRAWEEPATDDRHRVRLQYPRQQGAEGSLVRPQQITLQCRGAQHTSFEKLEVDSFEPSKNSRPPAGVRRGARVVRQLRPVRSWPEVMLDVVAVIEEGKIVEQAIVADRATRVFEAAMEVADRETDDVAGDIDTPERIRG